MARDPGRIPGKFAVANAAQVRLNWTQPNGKVVHNVLHARVAGGFVFSTTVAQAIYASILGSAAWTAWKAYVNAACTFQGVDIRDLSTFDNAILASTGGATAGTGALLALPPSVAICITLRTPRAGQANRGRVYLPCLDSAAEVGATGAILAAANTAAVNFVTQVATSMGLSAMTLAILQPPRVGYTGAKTGTVHPLRLGATVDVTGYAARSTTFRSQRRRALRV